MSKNRFKSKKSKNKKIFKVKYIIYLFFIYLIANLTFNYLKDIKINIDNKEEYYYGNKKI